MKKILCFTMAVIMLISMCSFSAFAATAVPASEVDPDNEFKYEELIFDKLFTQSQLEDPYYDVYYDEGYEYFFDANTATGDEATPDYVLIYLTTIEAEPMPVAKMFGEYVLYDTEREVPFTFGIGVYLPKSDKVYDLKKAYDIGIEGIENVFTEAKVGRLMGDMDKDRKLTIKDATYIQKIVAGLEGFSDTKFYAADFDDTLPCSLADFNRDRTMNVKDATAIQKHIAGIE